MKLSTNFQEKITHFLQKKRRTVSKQIKASLKISHILNILPKFIPRMFKETKRSKRKTYLMLVRKKFSHKTHNICILSKKIQQTEESLDKRKNEKKNFVFHTIPYIKCNLSFLKHKEKVSIVSFLIFFRYFTS